MEVADVIHDINIEVQNGFSICMPNVLWSARQMYYLCMPDMHMNSLPLGMPEDDLNRKLEADGQINQQSTVPVYRTAGRQRPVPSQLPTHSNPPHPSHLAINLQINESFLPHHSPKHPLSHPLYHPQHLPTKERRKSVRKLISLFDQY